MNEHRSTQHLRDIIKEITNKSDFYWAYFRSLKDIINPLISFSLPKTFQKLRVQLFFPLMKEYVLNEKKEIFAAKQCSRVGMVQQTFDISVVANTRYPL